MPCTKSHWWTDQRQHGAAAAGDRARARHKAYRRGRAMLTETVADCAALPPAPVQLRMYVALAVSAPVDCEPVTDLVPDQAPEPVHAVALVADQPKVEPPPLATVLGLAARLMVGNGWVTDTVADCEALPPVPVHVSV